MVSTVVHIYVSMFLDIILQKYYLRVNFGSSAIVSIERHYFSLFKFTFYSLKQGKSFAKLIY